MALVAGDINSVWPLWCCQWWQCVTQTCIHGNLASQCHWRLRRWPVSTRDGYQCDMLREGGKRDVEMENEVKEARETQREIDGNRNNTTKRRFLDPSSVVQKKKKLKVTKQYTPSPKKKHGAGTTVGAKLLGGGGWGVRLHSAACPFPDTAVWHGPVVIHWYHTHVNNMNKTDVIKIGPAPS